nr:hypothetical protein [Tanacetum cinerariifolium]
GGITANIDADEDVTLKDVDVVAKDVAAIEKDAKIKENVLSMRDDEVKPFELQEVVEVVTTAKFMIEVVTAASATIIAATTLITATTIIAAPIAARRRKRVDDVIDQVQRKEKEDNVVMRNMAGCKIDYFKGMSYDDIHPILEKRFNSNVAFLEKTREQMEEEDIKALKRASESQAEKAAKKQKLDKEVEELKK